MSYHCDHAMALPDGSTTSEERHDEHGSTDDDECHSCYTSRISGCFVGQLFSFCRIIPSEQPQGQQCQTRKLKNKRQCYQFTISRECAYLYNTFGTTAKYHIIITIKNIYNIYIMVFYTVFMIQNINIINVGRLRQQFCITFDQKYFVTRLSELQV